MDAMLRGAKHQATSHAGAAHGLRLLVVDDDEAARTLYMALLEQIDGVDSVAAAADGVEAVHLAQTVEFDVVVLDLNMPRLEGVEAAVGITALQPALAIAVQSSDLNALRRRADGLDLALFDKLALEHLVAWVADEVDRASRSNRPRHVGRDHSCARCGYGVATDPPPLRCPMCACETDWVEAAPAS